MHKLVVNPHIPQKFKEAQDRITCTVSKDYEAWIVQDQAIFIWLLSTISKSVLPTVLACKHTFEVWDQIHQFFNTQMKARVRQLRVRNGQTLSIHLVGSTHFYAKFRPKHKLILTNILHVPSITINLLSISKFSNDNNVVFEILYEKCYIKSQASKQVIVEGVLDASGLYYFPRLSLELKSSHNLNNNLSTTTGIQSYIISHSNSSMSNNCNASILWHHRLDHGNFTSIVHILKVCNIPSSNKHNTIFAPLVILVNHIGYMHL